MKTVTHPLKGIAFAAGLASASAAYAQEAPDSVSTSQAALAVDEVEMLSLEDMEALAGGASVHVVVDTDQALSAVNSGNSVSGDVVSSGQVNIGSGAFSGYDGIGNFVINTGHNNNLQSSMNVSVVLTPPAGP